MRDELVLVLDAFENAFAHAAPVGDVDELAALASTVRDVRDRAGYAGDTILAAIAGGTGSGKSSLLNAIDGDQVAETGGIRPTTGEPLAWIPADPEPGLTRFLDDLGIESRALQSRFPWLALIDLPDHDSVALDHRQRVDDLLPRVDVVIWVFDPEKYRDASIHHDYLAGLADYQAQFRFVLNQADRLEGAGLEVVVADLTSALIEDGFDDPRLFAIAADPDAGPPQGVEELIADLSATLDAKRSIFGKLATDLRRVRSGMESAADVGGGIGFTERWNQVRAEAASLAAGGDTLSAAARIAEFLEEISTEVGETARVEIKRIVPEVPSLVTRSVEEAGMAVADSRPATASQWPGWLNRLIPRRLLAWRDAAGRRRILDRARERAPGVSDALDARIGRRVRDVLRQRSAASAAMTELTLALTRLDSALSS